MNAFDGGNFQFQAESQEGLQEKILPEQNWNNFSTGDNKHDICLLTAYFLVIYPASFSEIPKLNFIPTGFYDHIGYKIYVITDPEHIETIGSPYLKTQDGNIFKCSEIGFVFNISNSERLRGGYDQEGIMSCVLSFFSNVISGPRPKDTDIILGSIMRTTNLGGVEGIYSNENTIFENYDGTNSEEVCEEDCEEINDDIKEDIDEDENEDIDEEIQEAYEIFLQELIKKEEQLEKEIEEDFQKFMEEEGEDEDEVFFGKWILETN